MIEFIGWLGFSMLALCAIPQCIKTHKTKSANDLSWIMLSMWALGEVFALIYIIHGNILKDDFQWPLIISYIMSLIMCSYLLYAKKKYQEK